MFNEDWGQKGQSINSQSLPTVCISDLILGAISAFLETLMESAYLTNPLNTISVIGTNEKTAEVETEVYSCFLSQLHHDHWTSFS